MSTLTRTKPVRDKVSNRCKATTAKGRPCKSWAILGDELCHNHLVQYKQAQLEEIPNRCAYVNKSEQRCKRNATKHRDYCAMHGRSSGTGIASHSYKNGVRHDGEPRSRYGHQLTTELKTIYDEARVDPNLLNFSDDIAAFEAMAAKALGEMKRHESGVTWNEARLILNRADRCLKKSDNEGFLEAFNELRGIFNTKAAYYKAQGEARKIILEKKALANSERKRQIETGYLLDYTFFQHSMSTMAAAFKHAVDTLITDKKHKRKILQAVQDEITDIHIERQRTRNKRKIKTIEAKKDK